MYTALYSLGKNENGRVEIWVYGKKMKEQKKASKTIDIVSYALNLCYFVVLINEGMHSNLCYVKSVVIIYDFISCAIIS